MTLTEEQAYQMHLKAALDFSARINRANERAERAKRLLDPKPEDSAAKPDLTPDPLLAPPSTGVATAPVILFTATDVESPYRDDEAADDIFSTFVSEGN